MRLQPSLRRALLGSAAAATLGSFGIHAASATIVDSATSALDVSSSLTLTSFLPVSLTLKPGATATGSGAASYSNGGTATAGLSQSLSVLGTQYATLTSNPNTATASFNAVNSTASASAAGNNLKLNIVGSSNSNVLSLALPNFMTTATVSGDYGTLAASGTTSLASNTTLSAFGQTINLVANPTVNQTIQSQVPGLTIVENKQTMTGTGAGNQGITVAALDFTLNNVSIAGVGTVSGDIVFGQSVASLTASQSTTGGTSTGGTTTGGTTSGGTTTGGTTGGGTTTGGTTPLTAVFKAAPVAGTLANPQLVSGSGPFTSISGSIGGTVSKEVFGVYVSGGSLSLSDTTSDGSTLYLNVFDSSKKLVPSNNGVYTVGAGDYYFTVATDPNHPDPDFTLTSSLPFSAFQVVSNAVPEPASLAVLGTGVLGLAGLRRRRAR